MKGKTDDYGAEEATRRAREALKRAMETPPQPRQDKRTAAKKAMRESAMLLPERFRRNFIAATPEIMAAWEALINAPQAPHDKAVSVRLSHHCAVLKEVADRAETSCQD